MSKNLQFRAVLVAALVSLALVALAPTLFRDKLPDWWQNSFDPIHLGLDLQGGIHLVLGVDVDKAVESRLDSIADDLETLLREEDIVFKRVMRGDDGSVSVIVYDDAAAAQIDALIRKQFPALEQMKETLSGDYPQKNFRLGDGEVEHIRNYAVRQAVETMRNRIDQFGVTEPVLQRQSDDRILIQLPGVKDPQRAIDLIGKTARLDFKLVADVPPEDAVKGLLPSGTQLLYEKRVNRQSGAVSGYLPWSRQDLLTGDLFPMPRSGSKTFSTNPTFIRLQCSGASVRPDHRCQRRQASGDHPRRYRLFAPVIRERISGGSAQISRSTIRRPPIWPSCCGPDPLPAPVKIMEDRTVGPSLGRDSITRVCSPS